MTNDNIKKCDDCFEPLNGACFVINGTLLFCPECAENLDNEQEADEGMDLDETDGDAFDDRLDMYMNEY